MSEHDTIPRREFLARTAAGAAALGLGLPRSRPADARVVGANDRINIAVIGVGGMGRGHFNRLWRWAQNGEQKIEVVGACDVWDPRARSAADMTSGRAKAYRDYRELLRLRDLDAVVIATPDHWHAKMSIDAMRAGKDVYCEKPMTLYWDEAKEVARVARQTGRVFQCGAQSASDDRWWQAQRIVKGGGIGPLIWSQTGAFRNDPAGDWNWPIGNARPGEDLDWEMWLGHRFGLAPKVPYDPERFFRFRKYWDYSGGLATDLLYHSLSHLLIGLGPEFPTRVVAVGHNSVHTLENDRREVPDNFHTLVDYPSRHTVQMAATQQNDDGVPELIRGQMATIVPGGPGLIVRPQGPFREKMLELSKTEVYEGAEVVMGKGRDGREQLQEIRVPRKPRQDHMVNFLDCIRSREKPNLSADLAYQVMVPIALSVRAFRENRVMLFDPEKETVPGERGPVRPWHGSSQSRR